MHEFATQPQITAMLHHDAIAIDPGDRFDGDCYGPALTALSTGAATYAEYLAGVLTFAGGLLTLDGDLLVPSWTDVLVEQSWSERAAYHQQARTYLAAADPRTVLDAVTCHRCAPGPSPCSDPRGRAQPVGAREPRPPSRFGAAFTCVRGCSP